MLPWAPRSPLRWGAAPDSDMSSTLPHRNGTLVALDIGPVHEA